VSDDERLEQMRRRWDDCRQSRDHLAMRVLLLEGLLRDLMKYQRGGHPFRQDEIDAVRAAILGTQVGEAPALPDGVVELQPGVYCVPEARSVFASRAAPAPAETFTPSAEGPACESVTSEAAKAANALPGGSLSPAPAEGAGEVGWDFVTVWTEGFKAAANMIADVEGAGAALAVLRDALARPPGRTQAKGPREACGACGGSGAVIWNCRPCNGTGRTSEGGR
jgi:hypothetical protein